MSMDLHRLRVVEFDTLVSEQEGDNKYIAELEEPAEEDCKTSSNDNNDETNETENEIKCLDDTKSAPGTSKKFLGDTKSPPGTSKKIIDDTKSPIVPSENCVGDIPNPPGISTKYTNDTKSPPRTSKNFLGDSLDLQGTSKQYVVDSTSATGTSKNSSSSIKRKSKSEIFRIPSKYKPRKREHTNNSSVVDITKLFQDSMHLRQKRRTRNLFNRKSQVDQKVGDIQEKDDEVNFLFARDTPSFIKYCKKRAENDGKGTKRKRDTKLPSDLFGFQKNNRYIDPYLYQMSCNYMNTDKLLFKKLRKGFHRKPKQPVQSVPNCFCKHHAMRVLNSGGNGEAPSIYYNLNTHNPPPRRTHRKHEHFHEEASMRERVCFMGKDETVEVSPSSLSPITRCCCDACTGPSKVQIAARSVPTPHSIPAPPTSDAFPAPQKPACRSIQKPYPQHSTPSPSTACISPAPKKPHVVASRKKRKKPKKKVFDASNQRNRLFSGCWPNIIAFHLKNPPSGKNCIKYAFFGLLIVVWSPCLLAVILAWVIMCPVKITNIIKTDPSKRSFPMMNFFMNRFRKKGPECEYQRMCFENCLPANNRSFMTSVASWYSRAVGTVVNSFNAMVSMLKLKKAPTCAGSSFLTSTHPNPRKRYTLYYANNRGWMMKPSQRSNTRSCASTRVVQNMRCEFRPTFWRKSTCNEKCQTKIRTCKNFSYECPVHGTQCVPSSARHLSSPAGDACPIFTNPVPGCICEDRFSRNKFSRKNMHGSSMFMPVASRLQRQQVNIPQIFFHSTSGVVPSLTEYQTVNTNPINTYPDGRANVSKKHFAMNHLSQRKNGTLPFGVILNCPCGTKYPLITNLETYRSQKFGLAGKTLNMSTKYTPSLIVKGLQEQLAKYWTKHEANNTGKKSLGAHRINGLTNITKNTSCKYTVSSKKNGFRGHTTSCEIALKCPFGRKRKPVIADKKIPSVRLKRCIRSKCILADISQSALTRQADTSTCRIRHAHKTQNTCKHATTKNRIKTQNTKLDIALNCPCGAKHERDHKFNSDKILVPTRKQQSPAHIKTKPDLALNCPCGKTHLSPKPAFNKSVALKKRESPVKIKTSTKTSIALNCPCGTKREPPKDKILHTTKKRISPLKMKASPKSDIALNCPCGAKHGLSKEALKDEIGKIIIPTKKRLSPVATTTLTKHQPSDCACKYKTDKPHVKMQQSPAVLKESTKSNIALNCPCGTKKDKIIYQKQQSTADMTTSTKRDIALNCPCGEKPSLTHKGTLCIQEQPITSDKETICIPQSKKQDIAVQKQATTTEKASQYVCECKASTSAKDKAKETDRPEQTSRKKTIDCACGSEKLLNKPVAEHPLKHQASRCACKIKTSTTHEIVQTEQTLVDCACGSEKLLKPVAKNLSKHQASECDCKTKTSTTHQIVQTEKTLSHKKTVDCACGSKKLLKPVEKNLSKHQASECDCKTKTSTTHQIVQTEKTLSHKKTVDCACGSKKLLKPLAKNPSKHQASECDCKTKTSTTDQIVQTEKTLSHKKTVDCACGSKKLLKPLAKNPSKHQASECVCKTTTSTTHQIVQTDKTLSHKKIVDCACGSEKLIKPVAKNPSKHQASQCACKTKSKTTHEIVQTDQSASLKKMVDCACESNKQQSKTRTKLFQKQKNLKCSCKDVSTSYEKTVPTKQRASIKAIDCGCNLKESRNFNCPCSIVLTPKRNIVENKADNQNQSMLKEISECACWPKPSTNERVSPYTTDIETQSESSKQLAARKGSSLKYATALNCPCGAKQDQKQQKKTIKFYNTCVVQYPSNQQVTNLQTWPDLTKCTQTVTDSKLFRSKTSLMYNTAVDGGWRTDSKSNILFREPFYTDRTLLANRTETKPTKLLSPSIGTVSQCECPTNPSIKSDNKQPNKGNSSDNSSKHSLSQLPKPNQEPSLGKPTQCDCPSKQPSSTTTSANENLHESGSSGKTSEHLLRQQGIKPLPIIGLPQTDKLIRQISNHRGSGPLFGVASNCPCGLTHQQTSPDQDLKQIADDKKSAYTHTNVPAIQPPKPHEQSLRKTSDGLEEQIKSFGIAPDCTCNTNEHIFSQSRTGQKQSRTFGVLSDRQSSTNPDSLNKNIQSPTLGIASDCVCQTKELSVDAAKKSLHINDLGAQTSAFKIENSKIYLGENLPSQRVKYSQTPSHTSHPKKTENSLTPEKQLRKQISSKISQIKSKLSQIPSKISPKPSTALDPRQTGSVKNALAQTSKSSKQFQTPQKQSSKKISSRNQTSSTHMKNPFYRKTDLKQHFPPYGEKGTQSKSLAFNQPSDGVRESRLSDLRHSTDINSNKDKTQITLSRQAPLEFPPSHDTLMHTKCTCSIENLQEPALKTKSRFKSVEHKKQLIENKCPCSHKVSFSESDVSHHSITENTTRPSSPLGSCIKSKCTCSVKQPSSRVQSSIISRHSSKVSELVKKLRSKLSQISRKISKQKTINEPNPVKKNPTVGVSSSRLNYKRAEKTNLVNKVHQNNSGSTSQPPRTSPHSTFSSYLLSHTSCICPVDETSFSKPDKRSFHFRKPMPDVSSSRSKQMVKKPYHPSLPIYSSHSMIRSKCCCQTDKTSSSRLSSSKTSRYMRKPLLVHKSHSSSTRSRLSKTPLLSSFSTHSNECRCHSGNISSKHSKSRHMQPRILHQNVNNQRKTSKRSSIIMPVIPTECKCSHGTTLQTINNLNSRHFKKKTQYTPSQQHGMSQFPSSQKVMNDFQQSSQTLDSHRPLEQHTIMTQYPSQTERSRKIQQNLTSAKPDISKVESSNHRPQPKQSGGKIEKQSDIKLHQPNKVEHIKSSQVHKPQHFSRTKYIVSRPPYPPDSMHPIVPIIPGMCRCATKQRIKAEYVRKTGLSSKLQPNIDFQNIPSDQSTIQQQVPSQRHTMSQFSSIISRAPETPSVPKVLNNFQGSPNQTSTLTQYPSLVNDYRSASNQTVFSQYNRSQETLKSKRSSFINCSQSKPLSEKLRFITDKISIHSRRNKQENISLSFKVQTAPIIPGKCACLSEKLHQLSEKLSQHSRKSALEKDLQTKPLPHTLTSQITQPDGDPKKTRVGTEAQAGFPRHLTIQQPKVSKQSRHYNSQTTPLTDNQGLIGPEKNLELVQHIPSKQIESSQKTTLNENRGLTPDSVLAPPISTTTGTKIPSKLTQKLGTGSDIPAQLPYKTEHDNTSESNELGRGPSNKYINKIPYSSDESPVIIPGRCKCRPKSLESEYLNKTGTETNNKLQQIDSDPPAVLTESPKYLSKPENSNFDSQPPTVEKQRHLTDPMTRTSRKVTAGAQKSDFSQNTASLQYKYSKQQLISSSVSQNSQQLGQQHQHSSHTPENSKKSRHIRSQQSFTEKQELLTNPIPQSSRRTTLGTKVQQPEIPQTRTPLQTLQPPRIIPGKCACSTKKNGNAQEVVPPLHPENFQKSDFISGICTGSAYRRRYAREIVSNYSNNKIYLTNKRLGRQRIIIQRSEIQSPPIQPNLQNQPNPQAPPNSQNPQNQQNLSNPQKQQKSKKPLNLKSLKAASKLLDVLKRNSCECPTEEQLKMSPDKISNVPRKSAPVDKPPPGLLQRNSSKHGRNTSADDGVEQQLPYPDFNRVSMRYPGHNSGPNRSERILAPANYYPPAPGDSQPPNYARLPCYINPANRCGPKSCYDEYALRRAYKRRPLRYIPPRQQIPNTVKLKQSKKLKKAVDVKKKQTEAPKNKVTGCYQCVRELVQKAEKEAWPIDVSCRPIWIHALKRRPHFWIYQRWPSIYPVFLSFYKFQQNICQMLMYLIALCFWCPLMFCVYLCCDLICKGP